MKNKKKLIPLAIIALLGGIVVACNNTGDGSEKIQLSTYSYDTIVYDPEADSIALPGSQYSKFTGRGVLPVQIAGVSVPTLRDSLMSLANITFNAGDAVPVVDSTMRILPIRNVPDTISDGRASYASNDLSVYLITPTVAVWENNSQSYMAGAAHGMYATTYVNYALRTGKILSLSDMFTKGYEKELTKLITEKLSENPDVNTEDSIKIPDNFCVTTNGITFVYGLYEVAPYSAGEIRVDFSSYEIRDLLSPLGASILNEDITD